MTPNAPKCTESYTDFQENPGDYTPDPRLLWYGSQTPDGRNEGRDGEASPLPQLKFLTTRLQTSVEIGYEIISFIV